MARQDAHGSVAGEKARAGPSQGTKIPADQTTPQPANSSTSYPLPPSVDTSHRGFPKIVMGQATPLSADLRLQTEFGRPDPAVRKELEFGKMTDAIDQGHIHLAHQDYNYRSSMGNENLPVRTSSVKSLTASHRSLSPASVASSPGMGPLADITPLPSPIGSNSGSWINMPGANLHSPLSPHGQTSATFASSSPPSRRKVYGLSHAEHTGFSLDATIKNRAYSNRSSSEYVPAIAIPRVRNIAVSSTHSPPDATEVASPLHREEYVAPQRGVAPNSVSVQPPTPPKSQRTATDSSEPETAPEVRQSKLGVPMQYEAETVRSKRHQQWIGIRQLGVGTFSTVMLATSDLTAAGKAEEQLNPRTLVAVKICEHGPAGGADEKKIESSLKRELEILKAIHHPSLVHLRAVNVLEKRAFLVLDYSAGGDLFELASLNLKVLVPSLVRRIFAELVDAVSYLHEHFIVHRDIKLENVLLNPRINLLPHLDPSTHPHPIITLTDLGLGRIIPKPPASPLLNTRCGSEDYAAPELLMGQEYDGRQTDAWALGVLLYALMEGRLPFDPVPGARRQSPTTHRIARCEWRWRRWGDADGDWDAGEASAASPGHPDHDAFLDWGRELEGARTVVEGLLKRVSRRWTMAKVRETAWVREGVRVEGGIQREEGAEY